MNHVAKYKEIESKSRRKYKKISGVALADQEMEPGGQLTITQLYLHTLISSGLRNNQKQKTSPHLLNSARCARLTFTRYGTSCNVTGYLSWDIGFKVAQCCYIETALGD